MFNMRKRNLNELALYELGKERSSIQFQEIRNLLIEKTADIVYLTINGRLYGILCLGDFLHRMENGIVPIVKEFTRMEEFNEDIARKIFAEKDYIQKIPVVRNGIILGDYSRWDDTHEGWIQWIANQENVWKCLRRYVKGNNFKKVYLVEPILEKEGIKDTIVKILSAQKMDCISCNKRQIRQLIHQSEKCLLILTDNDEWRGTECIDEVDYGKINNKLCWFTLSELYWELNRYDKQERLNHYSLVSESQRAADVFQEWQKKGINILAFYNDIYYMSDYIKKMVRMQADINKIYECKRGDFWPTDTEIGEKYFGELLENEDYITGTAQKEIIYGHSRHHGSQSYESQYYNIINGHRKTCFQPEYYCGKIYLFGLCLIMGAYLEDQYTIASQLQKILRYNGYFYLVENCGSYENVFEELQKIEFCKGDIVIIWTGENTYEGIESIDLRSIYEKNNIPAEWFLGTFTHVNHKVTSAIADSLFEKIHQYLNKDEIDWKKENEKFFLKIHNYGDILGTYIQRLYIERFFADVPCNGGKVIGCILIELDINPVEYRSILYKASLEVDYLIVFLPSNVQHTRYTFEEYIAELSKSISKNGRIGIYSGDGFIPYKNFFPSYYVEDTIWLNQAQTDIKVFSQCIAKLLNISYRFVYANSNYKKITQYNRVLKEELPKYGIHYIELS